MNLKNKNNLLRSTAIVSILGGLTLLGTQPAQAATVQVSQQAVKVAGKTAKISKKTYLYNKYGRHISKKTLHKNKAVKVYGIKTIKGKTFYNLGHGKYVPVNKVKLAKKATTIGSHKTNNPDKTPSTSDKNKPTIQEATMTLPSGYTRDRLSAAYKGKASADFIAACKEGVRTNTFDHSNVTESRSDDQTKVDPTNLTAEQQSAITSYTLRLINEARSDLGVTPWVQSTGVQKLAADIADEYTTHNKSVFDGQHYVEGIVRACKQNGLNSIDDNYIEDMSGFTAGKTMTITELKKQIYQGLISMLFGYQPSYIDYSDSSINNSSNYKEWLHAGSFLSTMGDEHFDNETFYFGLSITRLPNKTYGEEYSIHYINVSSYFINNEDSTFNPGKDATGADITLPKKNSTEMSLPKPKPGRDKNNINSINSKPSQSDTSTNTGTSN